MKVGLRQATIAVFEPSQLADDEKQRLFAALEAFVNLSDGLNEFLAFGNQNPNFFPVPIRDNSQISWTPVPDPCFKGSIANSSDLAEKGRPLWTKAIAWEPLCHKLGLFYRDSLRLAWHPPLPGPWDIATGEEFEILLGFETGRQYAGREEEIGKIFNAYPSAEVVSSPIMADWKTGTFLYAPANDFQRVVYILFREGWRAKVCARCSRRFIADKPLQRYCSPKCFAEAKRERNLDWWYKDGKRLRMMGKKSPARKGKKLRGKKGAGNG
jgi:hypothetical protein